MERERKKNKYEVIIIVISERDRRIIIRMLGITV